MNHNFDSLRDSDMSNEQLQKVLAQIRNTKVNVLLIGATGAGKSSTVNALFATNGHSHQQATVGESANPETMDVSAHHLNNLVIWDTPGLGDSAEKDRQHQEKIVELLKRVDDKGQPLIDLVLLVLDGGSRDLSSNYKLIKEVVAPNLAEGDRSRLLVGINKADRAMHSKFWDTNANHPKPELLAKLDEQVLTVKQRIAADTGFSPDVVYYSAGEIHEGELLQAPYNLLKLLSFILVHLPNKKRAAVIGDINQNRENFESNDDREDYKEAVEKSFFSSFKEVAADVLKQAGQVLMTALSDPENQKKMITAVTGAFGWLVAKKIPGKTKK